MSPLLTLGSWTPCGAEAGAYETLIPWPTTGIWVVNSVYNWGGAAADTAADPVKKTKDHPAILFWTIGRLPRVLTASEVVFGLESLAMRPKEGMKRDAEEEMSGTTTGSTLAAASSTP